MSDTEEFDAFYNATNRRLLHQMYAMTGNLTDAQDCVQEAYARAWQRWKQVRETNDPAAWIRTVAWRIAASDWRKARNGMRAMTRLGAPESALPPSPDHVVLVDALRQIPEKHRRAVVLHHLVGLSVDQIADETNAPVGTVKAWLSRGRTALAELLRESEEARNAR
jgi:RNA polymerase sigma-70 factor (ECF subfamily)